MDQVVEPVDSLRENPGVDGGRCDGSGALEAADESIAHPATAGQAVDRMAPGTKRQSDQASRQLEEQSHLLGPHILSLDDHQGVNRESGTFEGRPDIDAAMVLALRSTMAPDHSSLAPGETTRDRDQLALLAPFEDQGPLTEEPLGLAGRPDIDAAMVLALRNSMVNKNSFPVRGDPAPDQSLVDTPNPLGEP
jgi:hypothetical protein